MAVANVATTSRGEPLHLLLSIDFHLCVFGGLAYLVARRNLFPVLASATTSNCRLGMAAGLTLVGKFRRARAHLHEPASPAMRTPKHTTGRTSVSGATSAFEKW